MAKHKMAKDRIAMSLRDDVGMEGGEETGEESWKMIWTIFIGRVLFNLGCKHTCNQLRLLLIAAIARKRRLFNMLGLFYATHRNFHFNFGDLSPQSQWRSSPFWYVSAIPFTEELGYSENFGLTNGETLRRSCRLSHFHGSSHHRHLFCLARGTYLPMRTLTTMTKQQSSETLHNVHSSTESC